MNFTTNMFTTISKAGVGMYIAIVATLLRTFGLDLDEGIFTEAIIAILQGIGAVLWIIGQFTRKDLSWGVFRKEAQQEQQQ